MNPTLLILSRKNILYGILFLLGAFYLAGKPPVFYPDSLGYLNLELQRSMGYPLFLNLHKMLFGSYFISAVIATQYLFNFLSAKYLTSVLEKTVKLNQWLSLLLFLVMLHPVFKGMRLAQLLLSESLAYPLYLITLALLFQGIHAKKTIYFYYALGVTFLNLSVRGQFLFLVPLIIVALVLAFYDRWKETKFITLFLVAASIPVWATLADMGYHKIKHGHAVSTPWTGIQVITLPFFVSNKNDVEVFKDPKQKQYFEYVHSQLFEKKLLLSQRPDQVKPMDFYYDQYIYICNRTIHNNGLEMFGNATTLNEKIIANNQMTLSMTWPLLRKNFSKWTSLYLENFITGFDTSKYFLLYAILLLLGIYKWFQHQDMVSAFIIIAILATILNVALVAAAEAIIQRYTFYNNWVLIAIVFILFQNQFKEKTHA